MYIYIYMYIYMYISIYINKSPPPPLLRGQGLDRIFFVREVGRKSFKFKNSAVIEIKGD